MRGAPVGVTNQIALAHDTYYHPEFANCQAAHYAMNQNGHPYVAGSGFQMVTIFELTGQWDGGNGLSFNQIAWEGQQPGPGTGNTLTSQYKADGVNLTAGSSTVAQLYTTTQATGTGDGAAHDLTNDSVAWYGWRQWADTANAAATVIVLASAPRVGF
jgi:hypothetical protein